MLFTKSSEFIYPPTEWAEIAKLKRKCESEGAPISWFKFLHLIDWRTPPKFSAPRKSWIRHCFMMKIRLILQQLF